jgi:hypothetical protein
MNLNVTLAEVRARRWVDNQQEGYGMAESFLQLLLVARKLTRALEDARTSDYPWKDGSLASEALKEAADLGLLDDV